MINETEITAATLAAAFAFALTLLVSAASAGPAANQPSKEKCYGVALKGHNDCAAGAGTTWVGTSKVDYRPNSWKYVAKGTCKSLVTPKGHGTLTAQ